MDCEKTKLDLVIQNIFVPTFFALGALAFKFGFDEVNPVYLLSGGVVALNSSLLATLPYSRMPFVKSRNQKQKDSEFQSSRDIPIRYGLPDFSNPYIIETETLFR